MDLDKPFTLAGFMDDIATFSSDPKHLSNRQPEIKVVEHDQESLQHRDAETQKEPIPPIFIQLEQGTQSLGDDALTRMIGIQAGIQAAQLQRQNVPNSVHHVPHRRGISPLLALVAGIGLGIFGFQQYQNYENNRTEDKQSTESTDPAQQESTQSTTVPTIVRYLQNNGESTAETVEIAHSGSGMMVEQQEDGTFLFGKTAVEWEIITSSPDGTKFSIELSLPSPVSGYMPTAVLQEKFNSEEITNMELARFLLLNNVIPRSNATAYIEIVGRVDMSTGDREIIKTVELSS